MIRLLFVLFVVTGGFAMAAVWHARGLSPRTVVDEFVPSAVRAAVEAEAERLGLDVSAMLPPATPEPVGDGGSAPEVEPVTLRKPAAERATPPEDDRPVEVEDLEPLRGFATDFADASDAPEGSPGADLDAAGSIGPADRVDEPRLDESAALIRRMLAVYRRAGERK